MKKPLKTTSINQKLSDLFDILTLSPLDLRLRKLDDIEIDCDTCSEDFCSCLDQIVSDRLDECEKEQENGYNKHVEFKFTFIPAKYINNNHEKNN